MASFLDVTGIEQFSNFFVFIFVWLLIWALLNYSKIAGENKIIGIIVGFIVSLFVLLSPVATGAIRMVAPWIAVILVFVVFFGIIMKSFGAVYTSDLVPLKTIALVFIVIAIIVGVMGYVRQNTVVPGDSNFTGDEGDYQQVSNVIFHPRILGIIFIFAMAVFTVALLVRGQ